MKICKIINCLLISQKLIHNHLINKHAIPISNRFSNKLQYTFTMSFCYPPSVWAGKIPTTLYLKSTALLHMLRCHIDCLSQLFLRHIN